MTKQNLKTEAVSVRRQSDKTVTLSVSLVGLGFRMKRDVRRALSDNVVKAVNAKSPGINVKLDREQENRFDVNAIRVTHDGAGALRGHHLGYLRADVAAQIAPLMDDNLLVFQRGSLSRLDEADDYKSGAVTVTFKDSRPKT